MFLTIEAYEVYIDAGLVAEKSPFNQTLASPAALNPICY
jgi:hypothetical protein